MSDSLDTSARQLSDARQRGDADDIAEALAQHANHLLQSGRTGDARLELDEAAAIHRARGRVYDEARCTQMAATLCRFEGKLDEAKERSSLALRLADPAEQLREDGRYAIRLGNRDIAFSPEGGWNILADDIACE